jgi:hypothetical protein
MALTDNLVAYYKFDSSNSNDSVGSNNGTDTSVTYSLGNGKINIGAGLAGSPAKITLPSGVYGLFTGTSAYTVNLWVQHDNTNQCIFSACSAGNFRNHGINFLVGGSHHINFYRGDGTTVDEVDGGTAMSINTFYMVTAVFTGTQIKCYLNGTSDATAVSSTRSAPTQTGSALGAEFASGTYGTFLGGAVDEAGFWSRALSDAEITSLYNSGAGFQYPFVNPLSSSVSDSSTSSDAVSIQEVDLAVVRNPLIAQLVIR